jgi:hypothetical protein
VDTGDAIKVLRCVVGLDAWPIGLGSDKVTYAPTVVDVETAWALSEDGAVAGTITDEAAEFPTTKVVLWRGAGNVKTLRSVVDVHPNDDFSEMSGERVEDVAFASTGELCCLVSFEVIRTDPEPSETGYRLYRISTANGSDLGTRTLYTDPSDGAPGFDFWFRLTHRTGGVLGHIEGRGSFVVTPSGEFQYLPTTGGRDVDPRDADAAGNVVGMVGRTAAIWTGGKTLRELGVLPTANASNALAIGTRGQIVGWSGVDAAWSHATIWDAAQDTRDLTASLGLSETVAEDVNSAGQVAGTLESNSANAQAFVWDPKQGIRELNPPAGQAFSRAHRVNDRGQVLGESTDLWVLWTPQ